MRDDGLIEEIVEDLWDCTSCDARGIPGRELACPGCANGREQSEAYRAGSGAVVTDPRLLELANAGANWVCAYCSMDNRAALTQCGRCGASPDAPPGAPPDTAPQAAGSQIPDPVAALGAFTAPPVPQGPGLIATLAGGLVTRLKQLAKLAAGGIAIFFLFVYLMVQWENRVRTGTVTKLQWQRRVFLERNEPVVETAWDAAPADAKVLKSEVIPDGAGHRTEITGYRPDVERWTEQVPDGQEPYSVMEQHDDGIETYTATERVQDGFTTATRTVREQTGTRKELAREERLGNGFTRKLYREVPVYGSKTIEEKVPAFKDVPVQRTRPKYKMVAVTHHRPKFKTVERTKPIQVPITRQVPIPRTRVTYERRVWRSLEPLVEDGGAAEPPWPRLEPDGKPDPVREISRHETFMVTLKEGDVDIAYFPKSVAEFRQFKPGDVRRYRHAHADPQFVDR